MSSYDFEKIACVGSYLPRQCGIATFTSDLRNALAARLGNAGQVDVIAMDDIPGGYPYPKEVKFQIDANVQADYMRAAEYVNVNQYDIVNLQFEYGIFGGRDGSHIIRFLRALHMPVITTLHTALLRPSEGQRNVLLGIAEQSDRLVVISQKAKEIIHEVYDIPEDRIDYIPHGIPDVPFSDPAYYKDLFDVERNKVILTFGLLSPGKGIENMIEAMPAIVEQHPDAVYIVLGATHPNIKRQEGEKYRQRLYTRVSDLGMEEHIFFHDLFVSLEVLCQYIGSADIYVTPYINEEQISSGTLAYALGAGKAVVSTPYWYAQELLAENRGRIVPFKEPRALAKEIVELLNDEPNRNAMRKKGYQFCRPMIWSQVADDYLELGQGILDERYSNPKPRPGVQRKQKIREDLPEPLLAHLGALTDDTGIFQHAKYTVPDRNHGYCVDDNCRALIAACLAYRHNKDESILPLIKTYTSFIHYSFNEENGRFRNFMSYDRRWLEDEGSQDSQARTIWSLGSVLKYAPTEALRNIFTRMFQESMAVAESFEYARSEAYSIVGLQAFLEVFPGNTEARRLRDVLTNRLYERFQENATDDWQWCDDTVTYANAKIPQALILAGQWVPNWDAFNQGLKSLEWLIDIQKCDDGNYSFIGCNGWYPKGGEKANFDQQPIEAMNMIDACFTAYRTTRERKWIDEAWTAFRWFLGANELRVVMADFATGGCHDGLEPDGANGNEGAESTLAWLISLLLMHQIQNETESTPRTLEAKPEIKSEREQASEKEAETPVG